MLLINPFKTVKSIYSRPLYTYTSSVDIGEKKTPRFRETHKLVYAVQGNDVCSLYE